MPGRLAMVALLTGCAPGGIAVVAPWLELAPGPIELVDVPVGAVSSTSVALTNVGTGPARVQVLVDPPFVTGTPNLSVAPGSVAIAQIALTPDGYAPVDGVLVIVSGWQTLERGVSATIDSDVDDDGYVAVDAGGTDCDDARPDVHPDALEACDDLDNDCNATIDDVDDPPTWFPDMDDDGYGDQAADPVAACDRPTFGWVANGDDCDDADPSVRPDAEESWYDGVDQDCDGASDFDRDRDGFDAEGFGGADCNDADPAVNPDAIELPDNGIDDDCDGES